MHVTNIPQKKGKVKKIQMGNFVYQGQDMSRFARIVSLLNIYVKRPIWHSTLTADPFAKSYPIIYIFLYIQVKWIALF